MWSLSRVGLLVTELNGHLQFKSLDCVLCVYLIWESRQEPQSQAAWCGARQGLVSFGPRLGTKGGGGRTSLSASVSLWFSALLCPHV